MTTLRPPAFTSLTYLWHDPTSVPPDRATQHSPTCTTIRQGEELVICLNFQGNDAARVTRADAWRLMAELEKFLADGPEEVV